MTNAAKPLATCKLINPVEIKEIDGQKKRYTQINIVRHMRCKDMRHMNVGKLAKSDFTMEEMTNLLTNIVDVPTHVLDELTMEDFINLTELATPFFGG